MRWKIERLFFHLQNFRRLVVPYEFHAQNFLGLVQLGCIKLLLRRFSDRFYSNRLSFQHPRHHRRHRLKFSLVGMKVNAGR